MRAMLSRAHRYVAWFSLLAAPVVIVGSWWWPGEDLMGRVINQFGFIWILSVAWHPAALVLDRGLRESLMARLAGFREGDERELLVTAAAARATFLLMLAMQVVLLLMTLTTIRVTKEPGGGGMLSAGLGVDSGRMLDVLFTESGATPPPADGALASFGGHVLPHNLALVLVLLILIQLGAFRLFAMRRYEGLEA